MKTVIICIMFFLLGLIIGMIANWRALKLSREGNSKLKKFYFTLIYWIKLYQNSISVSEYFKDRKITTIAIYGMKELGQLLYEDLKNTDITVKYAIDRNADYFFSDLKLCKPSDKLEHVDMIVITVLHNNEKIIDSLSVKTDSQIVSIRDIISSLEV